MPHSETKSHPVAARTLRPQPAAELPRRLGPWELLTWEAAGRLADVYRARPAHGRSEPAALYAVKLLRSQWQDDRRAVATICREAWVGRSVRHPHLVSVLAANIRQPPYFVVMPWLVGRTLAEKLCATARRRSDEKPNTPCRQSDYQAPPASSAEFVAPGKQWHTQLDLPTALWIVRQAAEALDALHAAGWMHGDIKPSNLLVSPEGHVTLLDLGFARRAAEAASVAQRCVMGTCHYLAPETITSALRADIRSDIYSLGAVLFEMLCGRPPFVADDLADLVRQHQECRAPELRRLAPHVPGSVTWLVRQMLAKEPLRRPQTPRELIGRLVAMEIATFGQRAAG